MVVVGIYPSEKSLLGGLYVGIARIDESTAVPEELKNYQNLSVKELRTYLKPLANKDLGYIGFLIPETAFAFDNRLDDLLAKHLNAYLNLFNKGKEKLIIDFRPFKTDIELKYIENYGKENVIHKHNAAEENPEAVFGNALAVFFALEHNRSLEKPLHAYDYSLLDELPVEAILRYPVKFQPAYEYLLKTDPEKAEEFKKAYETKVQRLKDLGRFVEHELLKLYAWL